MFWSLSPPKAQINQVNVDNASKINATVIKIPSTILGIIHFWRNSTTALEPILAQKPERRAGRRPAQPKNPPPFVLFFRDFPRRDFLEAEKGWFFGVCVFM